jgi:hypothetical protein
VGLNSLKSLNLTSVYPNNNNNNNNKVKSKPLELRSRVKISKQNFILNININLCEDACEEKNYFKAKCGTLVYGKDCDFFL